VALVRVCVRVVGVERLQVGRDLGCIRRRCRTGLCRTMQVGRRPSSKVIARSESTKDTRIAELEGWVREWKRANSI
jgi:hypothetical protein